MPWTFHIASLLILLPLILMFLFPILVLWYVHIRNVFGNATTSERFGRKGKKKKGVVNAMSSQTENANDNMSTTTSLLAERLVEDIGKRPDTFGGCTSFKNCVLFC